MPKVLKMFQDKYTKKIYRIGDSFSSNDKKRIAFLVKRGFIEGASIDEVPSSIENEENKLEELTKKEIIELLNEKGIEYKKSDTKDELIRLLQGGE